MVSRNTSRKKPPGGTSTLLWLTLLLLVGAIFVFLACHAHVQLDVGQEGDKLFITNQIHKLEENILTKVDAGKKDIQAIIKVISARKPSFEETFRANSHKTPIISDGGDMAVNIDVSKENLDEAGQQELTTVKKQVAETKLTPEFIELPPPVPPVMVVHEENESPPVKENVDSFEKAHELTCPHAELVNFWRPLTEADMAYVSPFATPNAGDKYVTFEPDIGGWNNIRMQMETVVVFAAATARILVLPPDQPMYLLNAGKGHEKAHSFADFFPFDLINQRVPVITMEAFMEKEGITGGLRKQASEEVMYPPGNKTLFIGTERDDRRAMWTYLRNVSALPTWKCMEEFVIIPFAPGVNVTTLPDADVYKERLDIFSASRTAYYYDDWWQKQKVIHFEASPTGGFRLMEHFYTFIHFEDPMMDRYYKRFVRDFVHYTDVIFCKAAIIIAKLREEGGGVYSSFHIRRGDFQYKAVKISAEEMMENVGEYIPKNELIFVATDERNKTFFNAFYDRFPVVRYLDDYMESAGLRDINPNYLGMIDQIVCTRGHIFVGTWFSTFSGYITRLRGYMGYHDYSNFYGDKKHKSRFQFDELPMFPFYMREWNVSWANIDEY